MQWFEKVGFLRRCRKEKLMPKGLRVRLPSNIEKSEYGQRIKGRSEKKVIKRAVSDLIVKIKHVEMDIAKLNLFLMQELRMPEGWTKRMGNWASNSLKSERVKIRKRLTVKLQNLRIEKKNEQKVQNVKKQEFLKKKVVYNNSSRMLTEEQLEVLALGLKFGITPKRFPLVEYVQAAELLCQRLQEVGDADSMQKARSIRNVVFQHLKKGYKMRIKANLT